MEHEQTNAASPTLRACGEPDLPRILEIINTAAEAYRGVIPPDRWHNPYMSAEDLRGELNAGVRFTGFDQAGALAGVMGVQQVRNVHLIRHAYVLPQWQGRGVGSKLLANLRGLGDQPLLIGTWKAATWAIRFYESHGFALVPDEAIAPLLHAYWNVPARQVETSVVLASPILSLDEAQRLIAAA